MDISVNKPAKDFLKRQFEEWYSLQISKQLTDEDNVETVEMQPIKLNLPALKEKGAKWLVDMFDYIAIIMIALSTASLFELSSVDQCRGECMICQLLGNSNLGWQRVVFP